MAVITRGVAEGVRFRRAVPEDVVDLAALKRRVERDCYAHLGSAEALEIRLHRRCTAWFLLGRLGAGDLLLLAEQDDVVVGLGAAQVVRTPGRRDRLHLHSTYVERRGLGIGTALTAARLQAGAELGLEVVTADCLVGAPGAAERLDALGLGQTGPAVPSATFPGVWVAHWSGSLTTALRRLTPP